MNSACYSMSSISPLHGLVLSAIQLYLAKDEHAHLVVHITHTTLRKVLRWKHYFPFSHQIGSYLRQTVAVPTESSALELCSWVPLWENKNLQSRSHDHTRKLSKKSLRRGNTQRVRAYSGQRREKVSLRVSPSTTIQMPSLCLQLLTSSKTISVPGPFFKIPKFTLPCSKVSNGSWNFTTTTYY